MLTNFLNTVQISKYYPNDNQVLPKTMSINCQNIEQIIPKYCPNIAQQLSKYCPNNIQILFRSYQNYV